MPVIIILTPHSRRKTVTIPNANTTLLSSLINVSQQYGLNPSNYGLTYRSKLIDLFVPFRLLGIPNRSTLDMAELENPRVSQNVEVVLVLADGRRFSAKILSNMTLFDLLESFQNLHTDLQILSHDENLFPNLEHLNNHFTGLSILKSTTLEMAGLGRGRGLFRLSHVTSEKKASQEDTPIALKIQETKQSKESTDAPIERNVGLPSGSCEPSTSAIKYTPSIADSSPREVLDSHSNNHSHEVSSSLADQLPMSISLAPEDLPVQPDFSNFKFPEPTDLISNLETNEEEILEEENEVDIVDRRQVVFCIADSNLSEPLDDIDDSFFELTAEDVALLLKQRRAEVDQLVEAPLLTKKLKERLKPKSRFKDCTIRIMFPDHWALQGHFGLSEPLSSIYDFVRSNLDSPNASFCLISYPSLEVPDSKEHTIKSKSFGSSCRLHFKSSASSGRNFLSDTVMSTKQSLSEFTNFQRIKEDYSAKQHTKTTKPYSSTQRSQQKIPKWFKGFSK